MSKDQSKTIPIVKEQKITPSKFPGKNTIIIDQCIDIVKTKEKPKIQIYEEKLELEQEEEEPVELFDINAPLLQDIIQLPIDEFVLNNISFEENLTVNEESSVSSNDPVDLPQIKLKERELLNLDYSKSVGYMGIVIQKIEDYIYIEVLSQFIHEGHEVINKITAKTDKYLKLKSEKRSETIFYDDIKIEKELELSENENGKITGVRKDRSEKYQSTYSTQFNSKHFGSFILDGAGFVLMRYMVYINFVGKFETYSMHISGELLRSIYIVSPKVKSIINGIATYIIKIKRIIIRTNYEQQMSKAIFLESGHLLKQEWENCSYGLSIIRQTYILPIPKFNFQIDVDSTWKKDEKLCTIYSDLKAQNLKNLENLENELNEIKCCVKNYLVALLKNKPNQTIEFTKEYFQNFKMESECEIFDFLNSFNQQTNQNNL